MLFRSYVRSRQSTLRKRLWEDEMAGIAECAMKNLSDIDKEFVSEAMRLLKKIRERPPEENCGADGRFSAMMIDAATGEEE
jgi:hypothetical protein